MLVELVLLRSLESLEFFLTVVRHLFRRRLRRQSEVTRVVVAALLILQERIKDYFIHRARELVCDVCHQLRDFWLVAFLVLLGRARQ